MIVILGRLLELGWMTPRTCKGLDDFDDSPHVSAMDQDLRDLSCSLYLLLLYLLYLLLLCCSVFTLP